MIIDCHSHILPGIDDGASDVNMSMAMLDMMSEHSHGHINIAGSIINSG
ncbi:MAG: hypothetical protein K6G26_00365 [Lachnospiraceae bacterium]|nr:hypothetical protein [Lachnospiraceae bacterium]